MGVDVVRRCKGYVVTILSENLQETAVCDLHVQRTPEPQWTPVQEGWNRTKGSSQPWREPRGVRRWKFHPSSTRTLVSVDVELHMISGGDQDGGFRSSCIRTLGPARA